MHSSSPADDGPTLTARELRAFEEIAAGFRPRTRLDGYLTPRRRHISLDNASALGQAAVGGIGVALMAVGLTHHVLIAAPGFLALVAAISGLTSRISLGAFGLEPVTDGPTDRPSEPGHQVVGFRCEFSDDEGSPRRARRFIDVTLRELGFRGDTSLIQVLASELVTNSMYHGRPPFFLRLDVSDRRVRVDVEDGDAENLPVRRDHDPAELAPGGRGLLLVEELADEWGCDVYRPDRKTVWFRALMPGAS